MIYGDPIILGGGGGLADGSALLSVTVPAGSTVTATKNGATITPALWLSGTDASTEVALFVFTPAQFDSVNPWTITATDGANTVSKTVLITTNKGYELRLKYPIYLYNRGDQCTAITGGWTSGGGTIDFADTYIQMTGENVGKFLRTTNLLSRPDSYYTNLSIIITNSGVKANTPCFGLTQTSTWASAGNFPYKINPCAESHPTETKLSLDISGWTSGTYYVGAVEHIQTQTYYEIFYE